LRRGIFGNSLKEENVMNVGRAIGLLAVSLGIVFLAASSLMAEEAGPASPTGASVPEGRIVYVAGDGSGDFNCDGKDDHVEINQAIEYVATHPDCSTVHLKGPNTYWISDTIRIGSDTVLEGDATAVVKLIDHSHWPKWKAMIASKYDTSPPGPYTTLKCEPIRNITIRGFEVDGNSGNNRDLDEETGKTRSAGAGYDYLLRLMNAYDVTINDMHLHNMLCDGILFCNTGDHRNARVNARIFNNRIESSGHDAIYMIGVSQFAVYNNNIYSCRTNSAIRLTICSEYSIHHNVLHNHPTAGFSGNAGVQIQNGNRPVDHVEIYENEISRMGLGGIVLWGVGAPFGTQKNVHIHHNRIYDCNLAGIRIHGAHNTLIENNVLYGNWGDGIVQYFAYGPGRETGEPPEGSRYTTIVRNNIIANTHADAGPDSPWGKAGWLTPLSGFGLNNYFSDTHAFVSEHNCIYNSAKGDYNNASSTTDIHVDPLFVNPEEGDFHLQPQSPCRGAGGNGKDIGVYEEETGATASRKLSADVIVQKALPPAPEETKRRWW